MSGKRERPTTPTRPTRPCYKMPKMDTKDVILKKENIIKRLNKINEDIKNWPESGQPTDLYNEQTTLKNSLKKEYGDETDDELLNPPLDPSEEYNVYSDEDDDTKGGKSRTRRRRVRRRKTNKKKTRKAKKKTNKKKRKGNKKRKTRARTRRKH